MNTDGTRLRQIVAPRAGLEHPDWSPDGRLISFNIAPEAAQAPASGSILVVRADGGTPRVLQAPTRQLRFFKPVWSPNGRQLLTGCHDRTAGIDKLSDEELIRVAGTRWAIEECFQTSKGQVGLDEYQVRRYDAWYRHITLAMWAHAFLAITAHTANTTTDPTRMPSSPSHSARFDVSWHT